MAYRNKTFVSFDSADIAQYRLMCAWKANEHIDFDFFDAHDLNTARDTSKPETIRERLRERLSNTKQVVLLIGSGTRALAANSASFLSYEVGVIKSLDLPVVFANLNGSRAIQNDKLPAALAGSYTVSVSFQPKAVRYALDNYVEGYAVAKNTKTGPHLYRASVYADLGL